MKKNILLNLLIVLTLIGCERDEDFSNQLEQDLTMSNSKTEILSFSDNLEYEQFLSELDRIFYSENAQLSQVQTYTEYLESQFDKIKSIEKLNGFNSLLNLFIEASKIETLNKKQAFVDSHKDFFHLTPTIDMIGMGLTRSNAAILNHDGKVRIGDFIYQSTNHGLYKYNLNNEIIEVKGEIKPNIQKGWGVAVNVYVEAYPSNNNHVVAVERFLEQRVISVWEKVVAAHYLLYQGVYYLVPANSISLDRDYLQNQSQSNPPCSLNPSYPLSKTVYSTSYCEKVKRVCSAGSTGYYNDWPMNICTNIQINANHLFSHCKNL